MITEKPKVLWLCEYAVEIRFETLFSRELTELLSNAKQWLESNPVHGIGEVVISYQCLTVFYNPVLVKKENSFQSVFSVVSDYLKTIPWQSLQSTIAKPHKEYSVPVKYGSEDLEILSQLLNLSQREIIDLHMDSSYTVYMIGFLPGFPYMGTLPKALQVNRKDTPALKISTGSVAIAGRQTGIYSQNSPGGWYVLGKTSISLFDTKRKQHSYFKAGDMVRFKAF